MYELYKKISKPKEIDSRYGSTYFNHIFSGGYSSSYYSYMWSEVLDSSAFEVFEKNGIYSKLKDHNSKMLEANFWQDKANSKKVIKENPFVKPDQNRRSFLSWLSVGWLAYIGVTGGFFTVIIRFLFPNVLFEPPQTFKIGFPDDFLQYS